MENFMQAQQPLAGCTADQFTAFAVHCPLPGKWCCVPVVHSTACQVYRAKKQPGNLERSDSRAVAFSLFSSMCPCVFERFSARFHSVFPFSYSADHREHPDRTFFLRPGAVSILFPWPGMFFRSPDTCLFSWTLLLLSGPVRILRISYSLFSSSSRSSS